MEREGGRGRKGGRKKEEGGREKGRKEFFSLSSEGMQFFMARGQGRGNLIQLVT